MSRWREMIADYGRVFSGNSTRTSSEVYSVDGDLETQEDLRQNLEEYFRPLFQRYVYGGEKLACFELRKILADPDYRELLPPDKVAELADITDFHRTKVITYTEFIKIVMGEVFPEDDSVSFHSDLDFHKDSSGVHVPKSQSAVSGPLPVICRNTASQEKVEERVKGYRCCPPAFFMILVTAIQIGLYVYFGTDEDLVSAMDGVVPANSTSSHNDLWYTPVRRREVWRFLSYCLLHDGWVDLIFNVILQLAIGFPLEIIYSFWRVGFVYVIGVLVGSLGQSVTDHYVGLVGAAGGAYAVVFGHLFAMWDNSKALNNNEKESRGKKFACSVTLRMCVIVLFAAIQTGLAVYRRFVADNSPMIGIAAHVGGILAGFFFGRSFFGDPNRYPWQSSSGILGFFMFLFLTGFAIVMNIAYVYYPVELYD